MWKDMVEPEMAI